MLLLSQLVLLLLQCPLVGYAELLLVLQQSVLWQLVLLLPQLLQLVLLLLLVQLWQQARWRSHREWFPMCAWSRLLVDH